MRAVTILAAMAGCAKVPAYMPPLDLEPLVTVNDPSDVDVMAETSTYKLLFGRDKTVRMPVQFLINGVDVLGTGGCPEEDRIGIGVEDLAIASSNVVVPSQNSILDVLEHGPVLVLVSVKYDVPYSCENASGTDVTQHLFGETQFTMTANRINRRDIEVMPSTETVTANSPCRVCGSGMAVPTDFAFRSYWRFDSSSTFVDRSGGALSVGPAPHETCVTAANQKLAVVWQAQPSIAPEHKRDVIAYSWLKNQQSLAPQAHSAVSKIAVGSGTCGELIDEVTDETLVLNGDEHEADEYGLYRFISGNSPLEIRAAGAPLLHAFGVEIPIELDSLRHFRVTRSGEVPPLFQLQSLGSSGTLVWLYDGVASGETVTIEYD